MSMLVAGESKIPKVHDGRDTFVGCQANGCKKHVMPDSSTHCVEHSGGRKECEVAGCRKFAVGSTDKFAFCSSHGFRCIDPNMQRTRFI
jgi:hypothetical protein